MPSSWTPSLRLEQQFTGENINLWGEKLNAVLAHADYAVAGWLTKPLTGNTALSTANTLDDEARAAMLRFTGGAGPFTVTIPPVSKAYLVWNACAGPVTLTTGAGATVTVDAGDIVWVATDGGAVKTPGYGGSSIKDWVSGVAWSYNAGALPAQGGNAGKVVKTDGTTASWQALSGADLDNWTASAAVVRGGANTNLALTPGDTYGALAEVALTSSGGSVALDMSAFINGFHQFTEDTAFANPTNAKPGQTGYIRVRQHASAAKVATFGSNWKRAGGAIAFSATLSGYDFIVYQVITSSYVLYDLVKNPS